MRKIAILNLPCRGNEEFQPVLGNPGFDAARVTPGEFEQRFPEGADIILLPGSRETVKDLIYLRETGGIGLIRQHLAGGGTVLGICGGFQILGDQLHDPFRNQGPLVRTNGIGVLPIATHFGAQMLHCKTEAELLPLSGKSDKPARVAGIEGRSGASISHNTRGFSPLLKIHDRQHLRPVPRPAELSNNVKWAPGSELVDGLVSDDGQVWGTYLHMIFHNKAFMEMFFARCRGRV